MNEKTMDAPMCLYHSSINYDLTKHTTSQEQNNCAEPKMCHCHSQQYCKSNMAYPTETCRPRTSKWKARFLVCSYLYALPLNPKEAFVTKKQKHFTRKK